MVGLVLAMDLRLRIVVVLWMEVMIMINRCWSKERDGHGGLYRFLRSFVWSLSLRMRLTILLSSC